MRELKNIATVGKVALGFIVKLRALFKKSNEVHQNEIMFMYIVHILFLSIYKYNIHIFILKRFNLTLNCLACTSNDPIILKNDFS